QCEERCDIIHGNAVDFVRKTGETFDLIFADPPYANTETADLPAQIFGRKLLKKHGFLIIEHTKHTTFPESALYAIESQKKFGNTIVTFFQVKP
ncbi:MAG TPA: RsmD family RNA methyltransferase, partial [Bacteroidota bacterium]|nr:RsmD family RNA methyltransferase [Bacteroidota bacterium]